MFGRERSGHRNAGLPSMRTTSSLSASICSSVGREVTLARLVPEYGRAHPLQWRHGNRLLGGQGVGPTACHDAARPLS
jgi:hypothetical protein